MKAWQCFVLWVKGRYALASTYWVTGVIPGLLFYVMMMIVNGMFDDGSITPETALWYLGVIIVVLIIYTPLSLCAITLSALRYQGAMVWKVLALLAVARGALAFVVAVLEIVPEILCM